MNNYASNAVGWFNGGADSTVPDAVIETAPSTSSWALKLLVLFLLLMYSSIGALLPATNSLRPAMVIAAAAIAMMIIEISRNGTRFRVAWPETPMIVGLLGVAAISTFDAIYVRQGFETTSNFAKIVLIYVVIENTVSTTRRLRVVLLAMIAGGLMPALGTMHHFVTGRLVEHTRAAWVGVFANPNEDAYSLAILVPLAAAVAATSRWWLRIALWGVIGVYVLAIGLTFSRGGLLGLFAIVALLGWKQRSVLLKTLLIAGLIGGIVVVSVFWARKDTFNDISQDTTFNQRIATMKAGIAMFNDHPLLGIGPGCSIVGYPLYVPKDAHCGCQDQLVVHNAFIQILSETGALGFIPFMVLLGAALLHARKLQRTDSGELQTYAMGLEVALWGFVMCGLSGGFSWSWFPYILVGLIVAGKHIADNAEARRP
jgi:O-antigen ligase